MQASRGQQIGGSDGSRVRAYKLHKCAAGDLWSEWITKRFEVVLFGLMVAGCVGLDCWSTEVGERCDARQDSGERDVQ